MKFLLFFSFCTFSVTAFSQLTDAELKKMIDQSVADGIKKQKGAPVTRMFDVRKKPAIKFHGFAERQKLVTGVNRLKQDGMPCVVPDMTGVAAIPNAHPTVTAPFKTSMPNGYKEPLAPQPRMDVK
jgi:hypothetical protein